MAYNEFLYIQKYQFVQAPAEYDHGWAMLTGYSKSFQGCLIIFQLFQVNHELPRSYIFHTGLLPTWIPGQARNDAEAVSARINI